MRRSLPGDLKAALLCACAAALVLAGCGGDDPPVPRAQRTGPPAVGLAVNVNELGDLGAELDTVAGTGAGWVREDLEWSAVQPRPGEWDWSRFDAIVEAGARRGIRVLPILDSAPCWAVEAGVAQGDCWRHLPRDPGDFATFAARAVARYGPGGRFWRSRSGLDPGLAPRSFEVWNEPYFPGGADPVDPARFAELYVTTVRAGRRSNPRALYLLPSAGSVSVNDVAQSWPAALARAVPDLDGYVDGLSVHIYPTNESAPKAGGAARSIQTEFAEQFGVAPLVWVTELGLAACGAEAAGIGNCAAGATRAEREAQKARLMSGAMLDLAREPSVQAIFVYTLREFDRPFYGDAGLLDARGRDLPALAAFRDAARGITR